MTVDFLRCRKRGLVYLVLVGDYLASHITTRINGEPESFHLPQFVRLRENCDDVSCNSAIGPTARSVKEQFHSLLEPVITDHNMTPL